MPDPREIRNTRLNNEYIELMRINCSIIQIEPLGNTPYEKYKITFNIRTIISPEPSYRSKTVCILTIPARYPKAPPEIMATTTPYPWHINWFTTGRWCIGYWNIEESLANFIYRCAKTLQFDPEIANPESVANSSAVPFWEANKHNCQVIPSDNQVLPTLDALTINERERANPKIIIQSSRVDKPKINIKSSRVDKPKINIINKSS